MAPRSTRATIDDLQLLLQGCEQLDYVYDYDSLAALKRILRDRIAELEASVRLSSTTDEMHDMTANGAGGLWKLESGEKA